MRAVDSQDIRSVAGAQWNANAHIMELDALDIHIILNIHVHLATGFFFRPAIDFDGNHFVTSGARVGPLQYTHGSGTRKALGRILQLQDIGLLIEGFVNVRMSIEAKAAVARV